MKPKTLIKLAVAVLAIGLLMLFSSEKQMSRAVANHDLKLQTVPTRTPIPEPTDPPPPTNTPAPPPPTDTPVPPPPKDTEAPPAATTAPDATAEPALVVVNAETNVYSGPGSDYGVLGSLTAGASASVVGRSTDNSWWQIVFQGGTAWISGNVVTANAAAYNAPVVDASGTAGAAPAVLPTAGGGYWLSSGGVLLLITGAALILAGFQAHRSTS